LAKVKAVLFDLGGTLVRTGDPTEIWQRALNRLGIVRSYEEILAARAENETTMSYEKVVDMGENFWAAWNTAVLQRLGIGEESAEMAKKVTELWFDCVQIELFQDVLPVFKSLKQRRLKIGLVTNCLADEAARIMRRVGLADCFDVKVSPDTAGRIKPNREIFHHALEKLGVLPEEALFVGDSMDYDYNGAKAAGLRALLVDRNGKLEENVEKIRSLSEIFNYL